MFAQSLAAFAGRLFLASLFVFSGAEKVVDPHGTAAYMRSAGLPFAGSLMIASIVLELGASAMLVVGWKTRWAAFALFLFMIPITVVFHNPWASDPSQFQMQTIHLMKNLAIAGGLLVTAAFGPGPWSADRRGV
jgi:putative oxidoreductase